MYSVNASRNEASPNRMSLDRHSCRREQTQRSEPLAKILTRRVLSGGSPTGSRVLPRAPAPFPVIAQVERSGHHAVANLASKGVRQPVAFGGKRTAELDAAPVDDAAQISLICPTLVRAGQFVAVGGDHQRMLCAAGLVFHFHSPGSGQIGYRQRQRLRRATLRGGTENLVEALRDDLVLAGFNGTRLDQELVAGTPGV